MTAPRPEGEPVPDIGTEYEVSGSFDKDEQGWCSARVCIAPTGARVSVREWSDANGIIRSDHTQEGTIGAVEGGVAAIRMDDGTTRRFRLETRRLE